MGQKFQEGLLFLVPPVGIKIVGQFPVGGIWSPEVLHYPVQLRQPLHVFPKHLFLGSGLPDFDLHEEISLLHSLFNL